MEKIAPIVWPVGNRTAFCYTSRSEEKKSCDAKSGNPFGPYWDNFNVEFDDNIFYGPLGYDVKYGNYPNKWLTKYPAEKYPVIAFTGVPGSFPVEEYNVPLQKYMIWSTEIESKAMKFLKSQNKKNEKIIGIHLRIGMDFERACEYIKEDIKMNFFASPQCIGYNFEHGTLKREMCYPSKSVMIDQLKNAIEKHEAKYVYVASDNDYMFSDFKKEIDNVGVLYF
jgi:peptide-O-fucosyltransferase